MAWDTRKQSATCDAVGLVGFGDLGIKGLGLGLGFGVVVRSSKADEAALLWVISHLSAQEASRALGPGLNMAQKPYRLWSLGPKAIKYES